MWVGKLAWRGIGDFTENGRAARAGGRRKIRGAPMECFVGKQRKGKGFLGVSGNAELRRGQNVDAGKGNRELREDQRVVGTAA